MRTLTYYEKYKDIHEKWSICESEVKKILDNAFTQLIEELIDDTPWELHKSFKDTRTNDAYVYDLIEGRLFEDLLVLWYQSRGYDAKRVGFDADNKIIRSGWTKTITNADLEVNGKLVEVQVSRHGRRAKYHIKKHKGDRILNGINTLQFIVGDEYFLVGRAEIAKAPLIRNPCFGGKECYELVNVLYTNFNDSCDIPISSTY